MPYDTNGEAVEVRPPYIQYPPLTDRTKSEGYGYMFNKPFNYEPGWQLKYLLNVSVPSPLETAPPDSQVQINNIVDEVREDIPQEAKYQFVIESIQHEADITEDNLRIGYESYESFYHRVALILRLFKEAT